MALTLVLPLNLSLGGPWPQATPPQTPAQKTAGPTDGGWPRLYKLASGGSTMIYQPQVASWDDQKHMVAWAAVSYQAQSAKQPALGTVKVEADTKVALDERLVNFSPLRITESGSRARFAGLVHHTEAEREWAYDRQSHIRHLEKPLDEATSRKCVVVDMKQDWKGSYPSQNLGLTISNSNYHQRSQPQ